MLKFIKLFAMTEPTKIAHLWHLHYSWTWKKLINSQGLSSGEKNSMQKFSPLCQLIAQLPGYDVI